MTAARRAAAAVLPLVLVACACSGDSDNGEAANRTPSTSAAPATVVVRGHASLDGSPFDGQFIGAVVVRDGLVTPCQASLPRVERGLYVIEVMGSSKAAGCGEPGSHVLLWTFANDKQYFSTDDVAWPADGRPTTFDAEFTTSEPDGAARPRSEFAGEVFDAAGSQLPDGTRVEAFVGETRCGVASVRTSGDFTGFSLTVVGPDSVPGCDRDAEITFRVNGEPAATTAVNDLRSHPSVDLRLAATTTS